MRALKWIGIAVGAVLVLFVIAIVAIVALVNPNDYRGRLQDLVKEHTGRELALQGDLKLSVFPWIAVELGPATLGNAPGFGKEPMLAVREARLGLKFWPLLHGRFEIGSVQLKGPAVRLEVDAHGGNNWSDLLGKRAAAAPEAGGGARFEGSVASVAVEDGSLVYIDHQAGTTRRISDLALRTGRVTPGQPFQLHFQTAVTTDAATRLDVALDARVRLDPDARQYQLEAPALALKLSGKGWPAGGVPATLKLARVDADLKAQTLELAGLDLNAGGAHVTGDISGSSILDAPQLRGPVHLADVAPRELAAKLGIELPATRDPAVFRHFKLDGALDATAHAVGIEALKARLDDTALAGSAGMNLDSHALRFNLQADRIDADRYLAPQPKAPAAKRAAPAAPIAIPVDALRALELQGELRAGGARFAGIEYSQLHFGVNAHAGRVHVFPSEAQMYGGQYRGDITLDASGAVPKASFDEHVSGVDFAPLFRDLFDSKRFSGRGNASARLSASGRDTAAMLRTLSGNVSFDVQNGAFEGVDLWYEIRRARALLRRQMPPARTGPERTPFTALHATGKVDGGVLSNDDLSVAMAYLKVSGRGTVDLAAGTLDYRLEAEVPRAIDQFDKEVGDAADLAGYTIPVRVSGPLSDPKVRPDLEGLAKSAIKQKVEEKLKETLKDKLKGLFGN